MVAVLVGGLAVLTAWPALATSGATPARPAVARARQLEHSIVARINASRKANGLRPLRLVVSLADAAERHARSMARNGFFSHTSADGTAPATRIRRFYGAGSAVGETILWRSPAATPEQAVQMWLASPGHRAILLSSRFREIGLAAVHVDQAPGVFTGLPVTIVVADFGSR